MKFDTPATTNPIDQLKVVGKPTDRIDGQLKTTGTAPYAYERHDVVPNPAYGFIVGSAIAEGPHRLDGSDRGQGRARRARHRHGATCRQARQGQMQHRQLLGGPEIEHYHQAIALVVAETFEQARAAAQPGPRRLCHGQGIIRSRAAAKIGDRRQLRDQRSARPIGVGDFARRFRQRRRSSSMQPTRRRTSRHAMMEPHASMAAWNGDKLTRLDLEPDDRLGQQRPGADARHPEGKCPPDLALHRRRLRQQAVGCVPTLCWRRSARVPRGGR